VADNVSGARQSGLLMSLPPATTSPGYIGRNLTGAASFAVRVTRKSEGNSVCSAGVGKGGSPPPTRTPDHCFPTMPFIELGVDSSFHAPNAGAGLLTGKLSLTSDRPILIRRFSKLL
jgi:hypothetical protein